MKIWSVLHQYNTFHQKGNITILIKHSTRIEDGMARGLPYTMNEELTCKLCMKTFKFQIAREFHFDVIHNFCMYMCKYCENSEDQEQKGITYSYFELLDHIYSFHGTNPYSVLSYLNIF